MNQSGKPHSEQDPLAFLLGGGEMGALIRAKDWAKTPLGPIQSWPQSLRTTVNICLASDLPICVIWGPGLVQLYNDGYRVICGGKHPRSMGQNFYTCWKEAWPVIGEAHDAARAGNTAFLESQHIFLERHGYVEECFFTFSFSPIRDEAGRVGGLFHPVIEMTAKMLGERRTRTLRDVAARTAKARAVDNACTLAMGALADYDLDLPFVLSYLFDSDGTTARLVAATGLPFGTTASPERIGTESPTSTFWPLAEVFHSGQAVVIDNLEERFGPFSCGPYAEAPRVALALPLTRPGYERPVGVLIAGVSGRLKLNPAYRDFYDLLASAVSTAIASSRAYEEEKHRAEALAELDRAKTAFFSNVSHEFRTPLTLMLGPIEELLDNSRTELPLAVAGQLAVVNRNGLRLLKLVNTLLDFSRIEAGRVRAAFQPTDLAAFTAELASVFRSACERAGLRLTVDCPPLGEPVFVDREMWEKIVLNLLSNAFKFTFEGEIVVTLRRAGRAAELVVRDTGTGIPAAEIPRLFERFHRVENARGRTHEGSGIGLALVQELVKLHGGCIVAESVVETGTTFTVTVPLGSAHLPLDQMGEGRRPAASGTAAISYVEETLRWLPSDEVASTAASRVALSSALISDHWPLTTAERPRVLVADDNADMRQYVVRLLAEHYRTDAVADGEAALAAARDQPPDLILTDVMMPRLDGFGLLRALRADPRTSSVPVIMLSARAGEECRIEGMEAGADDYLVKPFSARELLARVTAQLQMARMRREASAAIRASEERQLVALTAARLVAWEWTSANGKLQVSENAADVFGLLAGVGLTGIDQGLALVHPDDLAAYRATYQKAVDDRGSYFTSYRLVRPDDGRVVWIEEQGHTAFDSPGGGVRLYGVAMDVTDRQRAEVRRRESEELLRRVFENTGDCIKVLDLDARLMEMNGPGQCVLEIEDFAAVRGSEWAAFWNGPHRADADTALATARAGGVGRFSGFCPTAKRTPKWWDVMVTAVLGGDGQPVRLLSVSRDITDQRRNQERLQQSEEKLRTLFESMDEGFCVIEILFDADSQPVDYRFLEINPAFEKHSGLRNAVGKRIREIAPDHDAHWFEIYGRVAVAGVPVRFVNEAKALNRWFDVYAFRLGDARSRKVAVLFNDITPRKRAEVERERLVAQLREEDQRKNEFLATLAHELRNPLAPIRNGLQVIRLAGASGAIEKARIMMDRQLTQLVRLVDDLLDVSRVTSGKLELRRERVELRAVIAAAVEDARPQIEQAGHVFTVALPDDPLFVDGDVTRLAQVVANLLNNSAKYTHRGGHVRLAVRREDGTAVITVTDDGIGIPPAMLGRVFEMFTQVDRKLEKTTGGLGIGLSLVKGLVEMHGGTIEARSEGEGRGSAFVVRLPVVKPAPGEASPSVGRAEEVVPSGLRRILVVDDNADSADSLGQLLEMLGNEVRTAYDGEAGVEAAGAFRPNVVLCDIGMPKVNGYDAARRIREQPWGKTVVLVALTGWGQDDDRQKSADAGFDRHLVKPVETASLMKLLAELQTAEK